MSSLPVITAQHRSPTLPTLSALTLNGNGTLAAYAFKKPSRGLRLDDKSYLRIGIAKAIDEKAPQDELHQHRQKGYRCFSEWNCIQILAAHESAVVALAWSHATNALLSVSEDRMAYVWHTASSNPDDAAELNSSSPGITVFNAVPQLIMLGVEVPCRPMCAVWARLGGQKLYVGMARGTVSVGRLDTTQGWWISRAIEPPPSPSPSGAAPSESYCLTALAAHPHDDTRLAYANVSGSVWVVSTFMKKIDRKEASGVAPFGSIICFKNLRSCVHDISWSPTTSQLCVVTHDSQIHFLQCGSDGGEMIAQQTVRLPTLPLLRCCYVDPNGTLLAAAGFDGEVVLFTSSPPTEAQGEGVGSPGSWYLLRHQKEETSTLPPTTASVESTASVKDEVVQHQNEWRAGVGVAAAPPCVTSDASAPQPLKSMRQRAFEFFENGSAVDPTPSHPPKDIVARERGGRSAAKTMAPTATCGQPVADSEGSTIASSSPQSVPPHHTGPVHVLLVTTLPPLSNNTFHTQYEALSGGLDGRVMTWSITGKETHLVC